MNKVQQVEPAQKPIMSLCWSGMMTSKNASQICELLAVLLTDKEVTIVTSNEDRGYVPEVHPRQTLYKFNSGLSFELCREPTSIDLLIAIKPTFMQLHFTAKSIFSDGTFPCPHNPLFAFNETQVTITWHSQTAEKCYKNYMVLSV